MYMRKSIYFTIRKLAKRNLSENNILSAFIVIAIFTTTFMLATIISLCVNQIEQQRLFNLKRGINDGRIEPIIYVLAIIGILVVAAGFFMINNVMSMSVSKDIRLYGLLKAVGMEKKQIRKMIFKQIVTLCIIGIPSGLLAGILTTKLFVPLFLRMYSGFQIEEYGVIFHPTAFIGAAVFTFFTAIAGAYAPVRCASRLSVIEAVKFSEYGYFHKIRTTKYNPIKIACRNIVRVPRRAIKVFCGLFLGLTAFLAVSVILGSTNIDMFMEQTTTYNKDSINLRNRFAENANNIVEAEKDVFSEDLLYDLGKVPGLVDMQFQLYKKIQMEVKERDGNRQNLPGYVYGINAGKLSELSETLDHPIDMEAFERGEFVILRNLYRGTYIDTGNVIFYVDDEMLSYKVGGELPAEFNDYFGKSYNWLPCIYMSEEALKEITSDSQIYEIALNVEKDLQEQALSTVKIICNDNNDIALFSGIETRLEAETILSTLNVIGKSISIILCAIGILNFISVIITEILARQHEFALLESVGESAKQIKIELMAEGTVYALITFMLVASLGSIIVYGLFYEMRKQFEYIDFTFPLAPLFGMVSIILAICIVVPGIVYRHIGKYSIADRLKKSQ
ncbi:MAG: FtsX-like permease family protein [Lachnospiraceae bacterium]|nr:FtsX-like permease family protein [Lachnospiraceae bacterium]